MVRGRKRTSAEASVPASPAEVRPNPATRFYERNDGEPHLARPVGDVLARLLTQGQYAGITARLELMRVWQEVAGEAVARHTKVGGLRRGVLEILVTNAVTLAELEGFARRRLTKALAEKVRHSTIHELRFKRA